MLGKEAHSPVTTYDTRIRVKDEAEFRHGMYLSGEYDVVQELIRERDIVKFIKCQKMRWLEHVGKVEEDWMPKKMTKVKLYEYYIISNGRSKMRCSDGESENLKKNWEVKDGCQKRWMTK